MFQITQHRRTKNLTNTSTVWEGSSFKEAQGQIKHLFKSQLQVMITHSIFGDDQYIDEERFTILIREDGELLYEIFWTIEEFNVPTPILRQDFT